LLEIINGELKAGDDAGDAKFFNLNDLPELSFDHKKIIHETIKEA
jgi:8-oxo-dGTP diphosphatase